MGKRKDKLMQEFLSRDIRVGDGVLIPERLVSVRTDGGERMVHGEVQALPNYKSDDPHYIIYIPTHLKAFFIRPADVVRDDGDVGINPIPDMPWIKKLQRKMFDVYSIISRLHLQADKCDREWLVDGINVNRTNFNPFVTDGKGGRHFFQRDYCWSLSDEREFIRSWYQSLQCGTIVIRRRPFEWCEKEVKEGNAEAALFEVIDGKQRLHCLHRFLNDKFSDSSGNRWSDLSRNAQNELLGSQILGYMEMGEAATDYDAIQTFLSINNTGKPMSRNHMTRIRSIADRFDVK